MDNMPSFNDAVNGGGNLTQDVASLAPLANTWHTAAPSQGATFVQQNLSRGSGLAQFAHFIGGVGGEIGHIAVGATKWVGTNLANMAEAPFRFAGAIARGNMEGNGWFVGSSMQQIKAQGDQLSDKLANVNAQWKAGIISNKDYQLQTKLISSDLDSLTKQSVGLQNSLKADQTQATQQAIATASDLLVILTAGFGAGTSGLGEGVNITSDGLEKFGMKTAADYLTSTNANAFMSNVEAGIGKLAEDPELFAKLTPAAQVALQSATAEVVSQAGATMTAGQIARASAVNLAFKYPLYFSQTSSTSKQLYTELDNKKYGDAVRTLAFNAALLLSGGPIGKATEALGAGAVVAKNALFGESSFIDELSKGIGNGISSGLHDAIMNLPLSERADVIKQMSAVEATNMAAAGKDPVAAAWRVIDGMAAYEGTSMKTFSHEEALNNMVNFAKAQRLAQETANTLGIGTLTVGRVDARQLNTIYDNLKGSYSTSERLQLWEYLKQYNPSMAWANNENIDKQIKSIISEGSLKDIKDIPAGFNVKGFPKSISDQLAKMGYVPISPNKIAAPFEEGSGTLKTAFSKTDDFFVHAVQPMPVLNHIGSMLTSMGLSPEASTSRVYQLFNEKLTQTLSDTNVMTQLRSSAKRQSDNQIADTMVKQLTNYSHDLPGKRFPITDLRQLTTKDVMKALKVGQSDAVDAKHAIMDAMLKVPLEVRGIGDKIVDANYRFNPVAGAYARFQGAFRFSWNPFFQAKLATKTEFLSQLEGGGAIASIFSGDYAKLDGVANQLRSAGMLESTGSVFHTVGGEAVADGSAVGSNLTHHLLPTQEKSIAGIVVAQAEKANMDVASYIKAFPGETKDTIYAVAQYDRNSAILNSPLMRTLNFAFFPMRFETKVAQIMAKGLSATSPMTQVAVIKGIYNGSNFLKSPEGQAWYSQNSEAIGLFKYFSPLATLSTISSALTQIGHENLEQTIGSFGELGGLPFGWIPQLLDAEGLTHFGQSYVNPKTGAVALDYVPASTRGQLQTAISDLLGSLFTYPGATAGLPSKGTIDRWAAAAITGGKSKSDFTTSTPAISPQQQSFQQVVQGSNIPQPTSPTQPPISQPIKVPPEPSPIVTPIKNPKTSTGAKKKKSQFTPALLPGQTSAGQL